MKDFGMLGRNDFIQSFQEENLGMVDKTLLSLFNSLVRTLDFQFREMGKTEISAFPSGIKIKIGSHPLARKKAKKALNPSLRKEITPKQKEKMDQLPRATAKSSVRRFSDKVVYELSTSGLSSLDDVFVSKLESGYEVKALGDKKIYINSIPISLPLHSFSLSNDKLFVEFNTHED